MAEHNDFGKQAEDLAANYLLQNGYEILSRNFRSQKAEVDIICKLGACIIFIEVKARGTDAFLEPHEAVNRKKIKMLVSAADAFMLERGEEARFDIISVLPDAAGTLQISHIKDAFSAVDAQ